MEQQISAVTNKVLQLISPKETERITIEALSRKLEAQIAAACKSEGIVAIVRVEGSVAKDTWLAENPDIDIFMRLPTSIPRKNLGDVGLRIAKKAAGNAEQLERFAEHPYLEVFVEGYRVDIVPCYDTKPGEWQSATDRTPYHTDYIKSRLSKEARDEVRLLKRFMQGVDVYGAEIKVGGFSGYLCELLIMHYGSFVKVVEAFAHYNKRVVIDIGGFYDKREKETGLLFPEPLVIVDPVDKGRNVASAVQNQKLYTFIAASRAFLAKPIEEFFFPPKPHALSPDLMEGWLAKCGSAYVFLVISYTDAVPDVLWGQLYRTKRSLRTLLETNDYKVVKDEVFSNESSLNVFVFELEQRILPDIKKHLGPQLERQVESEKFLAKYVNNEKVLSGPYIEDGRWVVEVPRKNIDSLALLREKLSDGGKNIGVAEIVTKAIQKEYKVIINDEILKVYTENSDFAVFLTQFIEGKPFWLNP
jgi:tRNA nucleotidyltransferase (CCA-adding enzyme)